jgi:hypothetical protein
LSSIRLSPPNFSGTPAIREAQGVVTSYGVIWQAENQSVWLVCGLADSWSSSGPIERPGTPSGSAGATAANIGTSSVLTSPTSAPSPAGAFARRVSQLQIDLSNLLANRLEPRSNPRVISAEFYFAGSNSGKRFAGGYEVLTQRSDAIAQKGFVYPHGQIATKGDSSPRPVSRSNLLTWQLPGTRMRSLRCLHGFVR